jgi:hypothetical protein
VRNFLSGLSKSRTSGNVCSGKVIAFVQQRLPAVLCQCICEAVPEIQLRRMSAAIAEITVCFACNPCLGFCDWFDHECAALMRSSNRRLAIGSRLPSIKIAASTKLAADIRRMPALSVAPILGAA